MEQRKHFFWQLSALLRKDLLLWWRTPGLFLSLFFFSMLIVVLFAFALNGSGGGNPDLLAGMVWTNSLFYALVLFHRLAMAEYGLEGRPHQGIMLAPLPVQLIFLSKWLTNLVSFILLAILDVVLLILFFSPAHLHFLLLFTSLILGGMGLTTLGTVFSMMGVESRVKEVIMAVLYFPFMIPLFLACVKITLQAFSPAGGWGESLAWLRLLIGFDILFFLLAWILFPLLFSEMSES